MNEYNDLFYLGQEIEHYACGCIVTGKIIHLEPDIIITKHEPIEWHGQTFTQTSIKRLKNKSIPKIL